MNQTNTQQVEDDVELLELMVADLLQDHNSMYHPTSYWSQYFDATFSYIFENSLKDFRSTTFNKGYLESFGAVDLPPIFQAMYNLSSSNLSQAEKEAVGKYFGIINRDSNLPILPYGLSTFDLDYTAYRISELYGYAVGAGLISTISASLAGVPGYYFLIDGKPYTLSFLSYYWRYVYCHQFIDFSEINNIIEIGPGSGKQVEVIRKLHPHINFYLLDLAPQLYVCSQFLKAVFGDAVVDYRETRNQSSITTNDEGKIFILGNWQVPHIAPVGKTLFWNAASFGEMEPLVVEHYLNCIKPFSDMVYLHQCMGGKETQSEKDLEFAGVVKPTKFEDYLTYLDNFELIDRSPAFNPLAQINQSGGYDDTLWLKTSLLT